MSRRSPDTFIGIAVLVLAVLAAVPLLLSGSPALAERLVGYVMGTSASPTPAAADPTATSAARRQAEIDLLRVRPDRGSMAGYDRDARFGDRWLDTDGNGCDARDDVLAVALRDATFDPDDPCEPLTGTLTDPYTGRTLTFRPGPSVQIDHVVSLGDAWRSGANRWTDDQRRAYANDQSVLAATDGAGNGSKSDLDASAWRPKAPYQCAYAQRVVGIKVHYGLTATRAEADALIDMLGRC